MGVVRRDARGQPVHEFPSAAFGLVGGPDIVVGNVDNRAHACQIDLNAGGSKVEVDVLRVGGTHGLRRPEHATGGPEACERGSVV